MPIKVGSTRLVRETTAPYEYTDEKGELKVEQIRVRYYSLSVAEMREKTARIEQMIAEAVDKKEPVWLSDVLPLTLESLPDLLDQKGKPIAITADSLAKLNRHNLDAIQTAISEDLNPKEQPAK